MSRVLITGGAGYIGSHTAHAFLDAGYDVIVLDSLETGTRRCVPPGVPFVQGDVGDRDLVGRVLSEMRPAGVVHLAGSVIVAESMAHPDRYYRNNTINAFTLFETCVRSGVEAIVFSSSASVYGHPPMGQAAEDAPLRPVSPYGRSKLMAERMLVDLSAAHGVSHAILRYFNVAGADPAGRSGQHDRNPTHLIKLACQVATGRRPALRIYGTDYPTPDGTCIRDYVHVSDLAVAHVLAYEHLLRGEQSVVLNCGGGTGYSVREVVSALDGLLDRPLPTEAAPRRPGDPPRLVADAERIRTVLGWTPVRGDLETMIGDALRWERSSARAGRFHESA